MINSYLQNFMLNHPEATIDYLDTGLTALGTSVAKTQLGAASVKIPEWAKSIIAIIPRVNIGVPTAAQSVSTKITLESNDVKLNPFECLATPAGALLGATSSALMDEPEVYPVGARVKGGENVDVYATPLVANTSAPDAMCTIVVSDIPPNHSQRFGKVGTLTAGGTTASADVAGTAYSITNCRRIVELLGAILPTTVAAADDITGYFKFTSSEFRRSQQPKVPIAPINGGLSTLIQDHIHLTRYPASIQVNNPAMPVTIQDYLYMGRAPNTAANFVTAVMFE